MYNVWFLSSARGVSSFVRTWFILFAMHAYAGVMEAKNFITLTVYSSVNVFIALECHSENNYV